LSFEEAEILRERADAFLRNADHLMSAGDWDLAAFSLEQSCQLILKYKLLIKKGSYVRTHSVRELVRELSGSAPTVSSLLEGESNLLYVTKLEDAYIVSRYLPRRYSAEEVRALYRFVKEVFYPFVSQV
jgi:HEPN domain-containing protein